MEIRSLEQLIYAIVDKLPEEYAITIEIRGDGEVNVKLFDDRDEQRDDGTIDLTETATEAALRLLAFSQTLKQELQLRRVSK